MKTLLVGGTGSLGDLTARKLRESGRVVVTLARSGAELIGDATQPGFGVASAEMQAHAFDEIVWAPGAVDWQIGPRAAVALHQDGTRHLLDFARSLDLQPRIVYVSSILAVGSVEGPVDSNFLFGDQSFRNWYEVGKHLGEAEARAGQDDLDIRILRFGPLIGRTDQAAGGIEAAVPFLCQGWPVHLENRGDFPSYAGSLSDAAEVIASALDHDDFPTVSTWTDPAQPSLRVVLEGLCARRGVTPKIMDIPVLGRLTRLVRTERLGLPAELLAYQRPLPTLDLSSEEAYVKRSGLSLMQTPTAAYLDESPSVRPKELEATR